ncbi:MAG: DUF1922 domain-containing protein [Thermoproteota archaeon]|jgi:hypothetical protein
MSRFVVGQCPSCGEIQAFYVYFKTKICSRCGKKFRTDKCRKFGVYNDAKTATEIVKSLKIKIKDGGYGNS